MSECELTQICLLHLGEQIWDCSRGLIWTNLSRFPIIFAQPWRVFGTSPAAYWPKLGWQASIHILTHSVKFSKQQGFWTSGQQSWNYPKQLKFVKTETTLWKCNCVRLYLLCTPNIPIVGLVALCKIKILCNLVFRGFDKLVDKGLSVYCRSMSID